jgi:hypothetical protein
LLFNHNYKFSRVVITKIHWLGNTTLDRSCSSYKPTFFFWSKRGTLDSILSEVSTGIHRSQSLGTKFSYLWSSTHIHIHMHTHACAHTHIHSAHGRLSILRAYLWTAGLPFCRGWDSKPLRAEEWELGPPLSLWQSPVSKASSPI